jgi:hypothetical protein
MISPIIGTIPYENFNQLSNFTLLVVPSGTFQLTELNRPISDKLHMSRSGVPFDLKNLNPSDFAEYLSDASHIDNDYRDLQGSNDSTAVLDFYTDVTGRIRVFEHANELLLNLGMCRNTAFIGSDEELVAFQKFNRNRVKGGIGKTKLLPRNIYWKIWYSSGGYVQRRMAQLLSSGIWHAWKDVFYAKTRDQLDPALKKTVETKQSLDTKLGALFKILVLAAVLSLLVFFTEVICSFCVSWFKVCSM